MTSACAASTPRLKPIRMRTMSPADQLARLSATAAAKPSPWTRPNTIGSTSAERSCRRPRKASQALTPMVRAMKGSIHGPGWPSQPMATAVNVTLWPRVKTRERRSACVSEVAPRNIASMNRQWSQPSGRTCPKPLMKSVQAVSAAESRGSSPRESSAGVAAVAAMTT